MPGDAAVSGLFAMFLLAFGGGATLVAWRLVLGHRHRLASYLETGTPWHDDVLRTAAEDLRLTFRPRRFLQPPAAAGGIDGGYVEVRLFPVLVVDQEVLELELRVTGLPRAVRCRRRANPVTTTGARTGDRFFDQGVVFEAPTPPQVSWLPASTRHALEQLVHAGGVVSAGTLRLQHAGPALVGAAEVVHLVRQAMRVARDLARGPVPLRELVASDPDLGVRLLALGELLRDPALDRDWVGSLAQGDDAVAVRAAAALGDEVRLLELVDGPASLEALLAVAPKLTVADARIEAAFRRLLRHDPVPWLLHHAGRLCSVAVVVDLLAVKGTNERAARSAVAAIQARALGDRGGLSMVDSARQAGQLSLADPGAAGALAEATTEGSSAEPTRASLGAREGT